MSNEVLSKSDVLGRAKNSLSDNNHIVVNEPAFTIPKVSKENLRQTYIKTQSDNLSKVSETSSKDLVKTIKDMLTNMQVKKLLHSNTPLVLDVVSKLDMDSVKLVPYDKEIEAMRNEIFHTEFSIVEAKCAIADMGAMILVSDPLQPRLTSLVTDNCIVLVKADTIVPSWEEALEVVRKDNNSKSGMPTNVIFIAGPSRTSDIELQVVFGVHGARETYTVVID